MFYDRQHVTIEARSGSSLGTLLDPTHWDLFLRAYKMQTQLGWIHWLPGLLTLREYRRA
jgi:hypothetical protein